MAVVELRAGAKVDLASGAELTDLGAKLCKAVDDAREREPTIIVVAGTVAADAAGVIGGGANGPGAELYRAPGDAPLVSIHRVAFAVQGVTPLAPLNTVWLQTFRNAYDPSALCHQTASVPYITTDGGAAAVRLRQGERLVVVGAGFAAGLVIGWSLHLRVIEVERPERRVRTG